MNIKTKLIKLLKLDKYDEYMIPFLIIFGLLYLVGLIKFAYLLTTIEGALFYIAYIIAMPKLVLMMLKLYQGICRILGIDKLYNNIKRK